MIVIRQFHQEKGTAKSVLKREETKHLRILPRSTDAKSTVKQKHDSPNTYYQCVYKMSFFKFLG